MASLVEMMVLDLMPKPAETISSSAPRPPRPVMVEASEMPDCFFCRFMRRRAFACSSSSWSSSESSSSEEAAGGGVAGRLRIEDFDLLLRRKKGTTG